MRTLIRSLLLVPALALTACGGGDSGGVSEATASTAGLSRDLVLDYGETGAVGSLSLEFTSVLDERCGVGSSAVCVWEGNAQVFLTATNGQTSQILTLNSSLQYPRTVMFGDHVIELRRLDPQPTFTDIGRPRLEDYTITLFVSDAP